MGEIDHTWTYKPSIVIILLSMTCMAQRSATSGDIGVFPRGNHWAVGHLMGKKSLENLPEAAESDQDSDYPRPPEEDGQLVRYERPSRLYGSLLRALLGGDSQRQTPPRPGLPRSRPLGEEEEDQRVQQVEDLLLLALIMKDNSSS